MEKIMDFSIVDYYTNLTKLSEEIKNNRVGYLALYLTELKITLYLRREDLYVVGFKYKLGFYKFKDTFDGEFGDGEVKKLSNNTNYEDLGDPKSLKKESFTCEANVLTSMGSNNMYSLTKDGQNLLRGLCYVISEALRFYAIGNYCAYFFSTIHNSAFMPKVSFSIKNNEYNFVKKEEGIKLFYTKYLSETELKDYFDEPFPYHLCDKPLEHGLESFEHRWSDFCKNDKSALLRGEMKSIIEDMDGGNYTDYDFKNWVNIKKI